MVRFHFYMLKIILLLWRTDKLGKYTHCLSIQEAPDESTACLLYYKELKDIPIAANHGGIKPQAASGIAEKL